uniref:Uncharacterized protein n=1 Tax=Anguilla anguilla TaxID=7936 RepID=A0A0E9WBC1_ANGAN
MSIESLHQCKTARMCAFVNVMCLRNDNPPPTTRVFPTGKSTVHPPCLSSSLPPSKPLGPSLPTTLCFQYIPSLTVLTHRKSQFTDRTG